MKKNERSEETIALNESLEIVDISDMKWVSECGKGYHMASSYDKDKWAFKTSKGYYSNDGYYPYCPQGGKKALKEILSVGGFLSYDGKHFIMPMK